MTFEECLAKGLLRKSDTSADKVEQSVGVGNEFLKSAEHNLEMGEFVVCEIIAYNALFHYARALLFSKGFVERSHACLFLALKKLYPRHAELFDKADKVRVERHNLQYAGLTSSEESAEFVLAFVKQFGKTAKSLLKK